MNHHNQDQGSHNDSMTMMMLMMAMCMAIFLFAALIPVLGLPGGIVLAVALGAVALIACARAMRHR